MKRLLIALIAFSLALTQPASSRLHGGIASGTPSGLHLAATRTNYSDSNDTNYTEANYQGIHYARATSCSWKLLNNNSYGTAENGPGGSATVTESIGYPTSSPTWYQVKWSGSSSITIANNATAPLSDAVSVCMNSGDAFWVRTYWNGPQLLFYTPQCATAGELAEAATSGLSDKTLGGTISGSYTTGIYGPAAVVTTTSSPSVALIGDSIMRGYDDIYSDSNCYLGAAARAVGPTLAYANLAITGENAYNFVAGHTNRALVVGYATSVISDYGTNDLFNGQTLPQLITSLTTIQGYFTQWFWQTTLLPRTNSSDFWVSATGQSAVFAPLGSSVRETFNSNLRTLSYSFETGGYFDWTHPLEGSSTNNVTAVNTGLWLWDGVYNYVTPEGVHPNSAANLLMVPYVPPASLH